MTRRAPIAFLLLFALAATMSGLGRVCPGLEGPRGEVSSSHAAVAAAAVEAAAAQADESLPPCHRKAPAATPASAQETTSPSSSPRHSGNEGKGCCDPASGMSCPHACHFLALPRAEAELDLRAVLVARGESPAAAAPAPLPRGVDHIPLT